MDLGEDVLGWLGPDEGFWLAIMLVEISVHRSLEVDDCVEDATLDAPSGQDGEEVLDSVEPGAGCRVKWNTQRG